MGKLLTASIVASCISSAILLTGERRAGKSNLNDCTIKSESSFTSLNSLALFTRGGFVPNLRV